MFSSLSFFSSIYSVLLSLLLHRIIDTSVKDCPSSHSKYDHLTNEMMIVLEEEEGERIGQDIPREGVEAGPDPQDLELMKLLTSEVEQQQQQQCGDGDDDRVDEVNGDRIGLSIGRF
jgi:hypothetical protein